MMKTYNDCPASGYRRNKRGAYTFNTDTGKKQYCKLKIPKNHIPAVINVQTGAIKEAPVVAGTQAAPVIELAKNQTPASINVQTGQVKPQPNVKPVPNEAFLYGGF